MGKHSKNSSSPRTSFRIRCSAARRIHHKPYAPTPRRPAKSFQRTSIGDWNPSREPTPIKPEFPVKFDEISSDGARQIDRIDLQTEKRPWRTRRFGMAYRILYRSDDSERPGYYPPCCGIEKAHPVKVSSEDGQLVAGSQ